MMTSTYDNPHDSDLSALDLLLDQGLSSRLTVVVGPSASERRKAISEWLERRDPAYDVLLIPCPDKDEDPDCPQRIFNAFAEAGISDLPPDDKGHEACQDHMVRLMNDLATCQRDLVVVLRDYEPCEDADRILTFMLEHLPEQVHLYLTCDSIPGLSCIPRLRVRRQFQSVGIGDRL